MVTSFFSAKTIQNQFYIIKYPQKSCLWEINLSKSQKKNTMVGLPSGNQSHAWKIHQISSKKKNFKLPCF